MTQPPDVLDPQTPPPPVGVPELPAAGPGAELLSRFKRMFSAPSEAFRPPLSRWVWLFPLILLSIWAFAQALLSADLWIAEGLVGSPEGAAAFDQMPADKMGGIRIAMGVGALAMSWVGYLVPALFFWIGLTFVLGGRASFMAVLAVTAFTGLVMLPRDILLTFLRLQAGTIHIYTSPAVLVDPGQKALIALAEHLDVFALYRLVLLGFGFRSVSGLKGRQTGWLVAVLWVLGAGLASAMTALGQRFGG